MMMHTAETHFCLDCFVTCASVMTTKPNSALADALIRIIVLLEQLSNYFAC